MSRPFAALILSLAAIWVVSPGIDWIYTPWGSVTAPLWFTIAVVETAVAFRVLVAALIRAGGGLGSLLGYLGVLAACSLLEFAFWQLGVVEEKGMLLRQTWAVLLSPVLLAAAAWLLRTGARLPTDRRHFAIYGIGVMGAAIVMLMKLYSIRQALGVHGETYEMLNTMLFAVAAVSALSVLAVAAVQRMRRPA